MILFSVPNAAFYSWMTNGMREVIAPNAPGAAENPPTLSTTLVS